MPADAISGSNLISPWNTPINVYLGNWEGNNIRGNMAVSFWNISPAVCTKLIPLISSRSRDTSDLTDMFIRGNSLITTINGSTHTWPLSATEAASACQTDQGDGMMTIVSFFFNMR